MRSSRYVLWFSALLVLVVGAGWSCQADEVEFDQASSDSTEDIDVDNIPDGNEALNRGGGSNAGDPIVYVKDPDEIDPANKPYPDYDPAYAPEGNWIANRLGWTRPPSNAMSIASKGDNPTRIETVTIRTVSESSQQSQQTTSMRTTESMSQVRRNTYSETFAQTGSEATAMTGEVSQSRSFAPIQRGRLDILLVVDNSGSMQQEVRAMAAALAGVLGRNNDSSFYGSSTDQPTRYPWGANYNHCSGISGNDLSGENKYNKCRYKRSDIYRSDWRIALVASSPSDKCKIVGEVTAEDDGAILNYPLTARTPDGRTSWVQWWTRDHSYWSLYGYENDSYKYYRSDNRYNPFLVTFMRYLNPAESTDSSEEHVLKKARWALEGKDGTNCDGSWIRDNASVAVFVATDEGHQCPSGEESTCSIDEFKKFRDNFSSHSLKVFGLLSYEQWNQTEVGAFSSYIISGFEARGTNHDEAEHFGHNSFPLFSKTMWDDLSFMPYIYSPLDPNPNAGSVTVQINTPAGGGFGASSVDVDLCSATVTSNCYKEVLGTSSDSTGAVQLVNYQNLSDTATIVVSWKTGGKSSSGAPFVNSWTLKNDPLPDAAKMTVKVVKKDGTTTTLTRGASNGYTISGGAISVSSADVKTIVPEGAKLIVDYLENKALKTRFDLVGNDPLPSDATLVPESALVNIIGSGRSSTLNSGFRFNGYTVNFDSLSEAPAEGEIFTLTYHYTQQTTQSIVSETVLYEYDYTKRSNTDTSRNLLCRMGSTDITCSYVAPMSQGDAGTITFSGNLRKGQVITIKEYLQSSGTGVRVDDDITLSSLGLDCDMETAEIEMRLASGGSSVCSSLGAREDDNYLPVSSSGTIQLLSASNCSIISDLLDERIGPSSMVEFRCKIVEDLPNDFMQMDRDFFERHSGKYKFEWWQIIADGQKFDLIDSSDLVVKDYKITEIKGKKTDDADDMRELFGGNDKTIRVKVRLYEAL